MCLQISVRKGKAASFPTPLHSCLRRVGNWGEVTSSRLYGKPAVEQSRDFPGVRVVLTSRSLSPLQTYFISQCLVKEMRVKQRSMCWTGAGRAEMWSPPRCLCQHLWQIHWSPFCCLVVQTVSLHVLSSCISVACSSWCHLGAVEDKPKYCRLIPDDANLPFRSVVPKLDLAKALEVQVFASVWDSELDLKEVCNWRGATAGYAWELPIVVTFC